MEDDKKGGDSASNPTFRVADIEGSKAGQQTDPFVNVRETAGGRIKKHNQRVGSWVGKYYKIIIIVVIIVAVLAVLVPTLIYFIPKWVSSGQQQATQNNESTTNQLQEMEKTSPVYDIDQKAIEIYNNNPDNADAVIAHYKQAVLNALSNSDSHRADNITNHAYTFFVDRNMDQAAIKVLVQIDESISDALVKKSCAYFLHYLGEKTGDENLKNKYASGKLTEEDSHVDQLFQEQRDAAVQADIDANKTGEGS